MSFSPTTKARAWIATIHEKNMSKAGLSKEEYENPELLADIFTTLWNDSGKARTCGIAVCVSPNGTYHAHMALYGNTTTLKNVSSILFDAHVEPQLGGKKELSAYLRKDGKYAEKGEHVLYIKDLDSIQDIQGQRHDLDEIEKLLSNGLTPNQIFRTNFRYRKFEKMIKDAYLDKRIQETPIIKTMHNEYHCGESKTGKTFLYTQLAEKYSRENIYLLNDLQTGGLDLYISRGAPPILFIDDLKSGSLHFSMLLNILDQYSDLQTHSRFQNTYNLWTSVYITSVYPIEQLHRSLVDEENRQTDSFKQLLRRFTSIHYHYVDRNGNYKSYAVPAEKYIDYEDLKNRALTNDDGFIQALNTDDLPFD